MITKLTVSLGWKIKAVKVTNTKYDWSIQFDPIQPVLTIYFCNQIDQQFEITLVAPVKYTGKSMRALEVEKGGNRQDQEQANQQSSKQEGGCHSWATWLQNT